MYREIASFKNFRQFVPIVKKVIYIYMVIRSESAFLPILFIFPSLPSLYHLNHLRTYSRNPLLIKFFGNSTNHPK